MHKIIDKKSHIILQNGNECTWIRFSKIQLQKVTKKKKKLKIQEDKLKFKIIQKSETLLSKAEILKTLERTSTK